MPTIVAVCGVHWIGYRPANTAGNPALDAKLVRRDVPTHPNFHFRKGGYPTNSCGGFHAGDTNWSYLTICVCLAQWNLYLPVSAMPSEPIGSAVSVMPGPASAPIPVSGPPIPRWGGLPPVHVSRSSAARLPSSTHRGPRNSFPSGSTSAGTSISTPANMASAGAFSGNVAVLVAVYTLVEPEVEIDVRPVTPTPAPSTSLIRVRSSPASVDRRVRPRQDTPTRPIIMARFQSNVDAHSTLLNHDPPATHPTRSHLATPPVPECRLAVLPEFPILKRTDIAPLTTGPYLARPHDMTLWQLQPRAIWHSVIFSHNDTAVLLPANAKRSHRDPPPIYLWMESELRLLDLAVL
ncbi:hypothetical protein B0H14DRAFT_3431326 [Mycena olivaceomarginata]|nr:hypothetical protein B0H14DRAFT_3431326 [Mycena olivaceomarginata]